MTDRTCHYCGVPVRRNRGNHPAAPDDRTRDHIIPASRTGGGWSEWNLVTSCRRCNEARGASWPTHRCPKCIAAYRRYAADLEAAGRAAGEIEAVRRILGIAPGSPTA